MQDYLKLQMQEDKTTRENVQSEQPNTIQKRQIKQMHSDDFIPLNSNNTAVNNKNIVMPPQKSSFQENKPKFDNRFSVEDN